MTVYMRNKYDHELRKCNVKRIERTEQNNVYIDGEIFSLDLVTKFVITEENESITRFNRSINVLTAAEKEFNELPKLPKAKELIQKAYTLLENHTNPEIEVVQKNLEVLLMCMKEWLRRKNDCRTKG